MNPSVIGLASRLLHPLLRTRPGAAPQSSQPANVLVIRPASLGDVLMSTAFLAALRESLPQADITVLATTWAKAALTGNPHCDRVLDSGSVGFPGRYGLRDFRKCIVQVRRKEFSHCFVLDRSPLMALLPRLAGIPWRAGLDSAGRGIALHVGVPCPDDRHEAELYLDALRAVGMDVAQPRLHFRSQSPDVIAVKNLLAEVGIAGGEKLIAVHPGGGMNPGEERVSKRWSSSSFAALADQLAGNLGAGIVLVGGPDDSPVTKSIQDTATSSLINLAGRLTLAQLGSLLQRCQLFIGNDSAPMHLAAAVGTPVVALFGPTSPEKYGPYGVRNRIVRFDPRQGEEPNAGEIEDALRAARQLLSAGPDQGRRET